MLTTYPKITGELHTIYGVEERKMAVGIKTVEVDFSPPFTWRHTGKNSEGFFMAKRCPELRNVRPEREIQTIWLVELYSGMWVSSSLNSSGLVWPVGFAKNKAGAILMTDSLPVLIVGGVGYGKIKVDVIIGENTWPLILVADVSGFMVRQA